jgi:hypothetical protein
MRAVVAESASWDIFTEQATREQLMNTQNNLLLQVADSVKLAGDYLQMLNAAAQNYARADIDSFPPTE